MRLYKWSLKIINQKIHFEATCEKYVESAKYCKTEDKKDGE